MKSSRTFTSAASRASRRPKNSQIWSLSSKTRRKRTRCSRICFGRSSTQKNSSLTTCEMYRRLGSLLNFVTAEVTRLIIRIVFAFALSSVAQEKITYQDHILPLIENNCGKCHNSDKKKGDLDLTSYNGALKGGGSGPVLVAGNPDSSKLYKAITHAEDPTMPPNKPRLPDKEIDLFKKWIAGGLLETSGSKAIVSAKPTVDLTLKVSSVGKPEGPPPMPK